MESRAIEMKQKKNEINVHLERHDDPLFASDQRDKQRLRRRQHEK